MKTAEEFLRNSIVTSSDRHDFLSKQELMIEFAKYHVQKALQSAYDYHTIEKYKKEEMYDYPDIENFRANKESILNAYPLDLIK